MYENIDTMAPFITLEDIKKIFKCGDDTARELMNNPDLHKRPFGKKYVIHRYDWDRFIINFMKYNGLRDLRKGFSFVSSVSQPGAEWNSLIELGFTPEQLADVIESLKDEYGDKLYETDTCSLRSRSSVQDLLALGLTREEIIANLSNAGLDPAVIEEELNNAEKENPAD